MVPAPSVKFVLTHVHSRLPEYQTAGAAGFDFYSVEDIVLLPGCTEMVDVGLMCEVSEGAEMQLRPRSSLAKEGITIPNSPGTIDCDYRGDLFMLLHNNSSESYWISVGERIAQGVLSPCPQYNIEEVEANELSKTSRGKGGFGSTGR